MVELKWNNSFIHDECELKYRPAMALFVPFGICKSPYIDVNQANSVSEDNSTIFGISNVKRKLVCRQLSENGPRRL